MKVLIAFIRLVRWPNLFFIMLTQTLYYFFLFRPLLNDDGAVEFYFKGERMGLFGLLMLASVLIAAGGYIINDYFDLKIDRINKPTKVVVDKIIKRRWVILWHGIFSTTGVLLSFYISHRTENYFIGFGNTICVIALWLYSTTFKKKILSGNLLIAALTAWVIFVIYFFVGGNLVSYKGWISGLHPFDAPGLYKLTMLYASFAFVLTIVREVIKDLEDILGDAEFGCRTMPIVWGVTASKVFVAVWMVVLMVAAAFSGIYAFQSGWRPGAIYVFVGILFPMLVFMKRLNKARLPADFHKLSSLIKWIMMLGILSMVFFLRIK